MSWMSCYSDVASRAAANRISFVCLCSYQEEGVHGLFAVRNATDLLWGYEVSQTKMVAASHDEI
jgi:hypothetical protein